MNKKKIAYISIGVIVLAALVIYYVKNDTLSSALNRDEVELASGTEVGQSSESTGSVIVASAATAQTNNKFDAAMRNARKAFNANRYSEAITQYKKAIKYSENDTAYAGLYTVYSAQNRWFDAEQMLDKAIQINPQFTDYYKWKIGIMDEKTNASFDELVAVYEKALLQVSPDSKINLVTYFAGVAERNGQYSYAMMYWKYAISLFPGNADVYQAEIDRLKEF
ncbi:hypothetical protein KBC79_00625 [Candidatus Woesebacteria bacterium]|nr:hypothetical protein [Candidatus Woesebacteria bacterium]